MQRLIFWVFTDHLCKVFPIVRDGFLVEGAEYVTRATTLCVVCSRMSIDVGVSR